MQVDGMADGMLEKSVIVAAHPDDEILWFSSIIKRVNAIIFCFLEHKSRPEWSIGRKKSLNEYPLKKISCLCIDASETYNRADWQNPVITDTGIGIANKNISSEKYNANFFKIIEALREKITGYKNVITHNPWGEYGHEDHVQVYRAVKKLQAEIRFNLWFSNYCSNKSLTLMSRYIPAFDYKLVTLKTDRSISYDIEKLYKKNGCWTWYDSYEWPDEESFIKESIIDKDDKIYGNIFPLNMININIKPFPDKSKKKRYVFCKLKRKLNKIKNYIK